jgi:Lar family restriction alleviation protein
MSKTKLLPCPFCGGEALLDREDIFCDDCHLSMRIDDRVYNGEAENYEEAKKQAIEAWNTRKPMDNIVDRLQEKDDDCGCGKISVWEAIDIVRNAGKDGAE